MERESSIRENCTPSPVVMMMTRHRQNISSEIKAKFNANELLLLLQPYLLKKCKLTAFLFLGSGLHQHYHHRRRSLRRRRRRCTVAVNCKLQLLVPRLPLLLLLRLLLIFAVLHHFIRRYYFIHSVFCLHYTQSNGMELRLAGGLAFARHQQQQLTMFF